MKKIGLAIVLCSSLSCVAQPLSSEQMLQYQKLLEETRCATCVNQNLLESNTPIAQSMREEILQRLESGENKKQVRAYLVSRYGEFITFRPTFTPKNLFLWCMPWLIVGLAIYGLKRLTTQK